MHTSSKLDIYERRDLLRDAFGILIHSSRTKDVWFWKMQMNQLHDHFLSAWKAEQKIRHAGGCDDCPDLIDCHENNSTCDEAEELVGDSNDVIQIRRAAYWNSKTII